MKNAGKACNNRLYRHIRTFEKIVKNYFVIYVETYPKLVTGVIINSEGRATIKNALRKKIMVEYEHLRNNPDDIKSRQRLRGLVTAARQVDKSAYPNIRKFAFDNLAKS